jgi:hypothetical protein
MFFSNEMTTPLHRHGAVVFLFSSSLDETFNHLRDTPVSLRRGRQIFQHSFVIDSGCEVVTQESRGFSSVSLYPVCAQHGREVLTSSEQRDRVCILMRVSQLVPTHCVLCDPALVLLGESLGRCPAVGDAPKSTRDAEASP